ncbi:hypothetical protein EUTSA_v10005835mg [Eutrema salsugineum]|uniref:Bromo domain-containing protein n=1 Tax=Eutrema salsugineum TaxID=72664 RepID=V4NDJ9_EUTSA|nr:uncharacterized protein LOC18020113 [Eutrema salsugineum]ESQ44076.1 hypothetical protein EUTSA_v10005835mg [Eutrema salsugineum]
MMKEEEEAVTSNGMNDDDDIYSRGDSGNNRIGDDNCNLNQISQVWGTWEELVLTCAVKRHGDTDWDSVAKEVGSRSSLNASAPNCRLKYQDLKRRFQDPVDGGGDDDGEKNSEAAAEDDRDGEIPWLEQLRSLRVAELRREVQRCDDSILSLQLKVKKLEEEKDGNDGDDKPDLEDDAMAVRSRSNETEPARLNRDTTESENRSMNESNSTASVDKIADHERLGGDRKVNANENSRNPDPDPAFKAAEMEEGTVSRRSEMSHSGELGESGTSTVHGKRRKGHKYRTGEDTSTRGGSGGDIKSAGNKSQPLIEIIKLIRSHPRGSVFESRLRSQETKDYKRLIRQHLDIKTIEKKMEKGSYVSSGLSFYRDLILLFTNAIVFFSPSSSESMAAQELRTLVSNKMKKATGKSGHRVIKEKSESSDSRQKSSAAPPLVVCKKKSSASKKTSPSSSLKQKDEKKSQEVSEVEKTVTTAVAARSSRRMSKGIGVAAKDTKMGRAKNNNKKQTDSKTDSSNYDDDDDKEETPKTEKKTVDKKKSVVEFLKRIKKNSPQKGKETTSKGEKKSDGKVKKENSKAKPRELRSNSTGKKKVEIENNSNKSSLKRKQSKKEAEEVTAAATGKRGRESGKEYQQPKKRSRR